MLPASTQVFTAVAAKFTLGDAFQFETQFLSNGKIQNNTLEGDLAKSNLLATPISPVTTLHPLPLILKKSRHSEN